MTKQEAKLVAFILGSVIVPLFIWLSKSVVTHDAQIALLNFKIFGITEPKISLWNAPKAARSPSLADPQSPFSSILEKKIKESQSEKNN